MNAQSVRIPWIPHLTTSGKTPAAGSPAFVARLWPCHMFPFREAVFIGIDIPKKDDNQVAKQRALIQIEYKVAKPFVDAAALGLGSSAFAVVAQGPALNWACLGAGFSLCWYWGSANLTKPKKAKRRQASPKTITVNSANGSRKVSLEGDFEYSIYETTQINRETWGETLRRLIRGKPEVTRPDPSPPQVAREFVFQSHYDGHTVELREDDVRRFLRTAWKHRQRGRGLSQRRWVREWKERPQWYRDLGPYWYFAFRNLLVEAKHFTGCQMVVKTSLYWEQLARDPQITLGLLRETEAQKGMVQPAPWAIPTGRPRENLVP